MNLLHIVFDCSLILTAASAFLLGWIVILRFRTDRRENIQRDFEQSADALLLGYLAGETPLDDALVRLRTNPKGAARLLARHWNELGSENRDRLHPIYASFPFLKEELSAIESSDWAVRLRAAERLACTGDQSAVPALLKALDDEVLSVRFAAARSLCILGRSDVVGRILTALELPGEMSQRRVAEVICELGTGAAETILSLLRSAGLSEPQLTVAVRTAGMLKMARAVPELLPLLGHDSAEVRLNVVRALASINDRTAAEPISKLAGDPSWEVRNAVMQALGRLAASDRIHHLLEGLSDPNWWVRFSSAEGLHALGEVGIRELRTAAESHPEAFARDISLQVMQQHGISTSTL